MRLSATGENVSLAITLCLRALLALKSVFTLLSFTKIARLALSKLVLVAGTTAPLIAQFQVEGHPVEIHGFLTQGFAYSNTNNYLTMNSSRGSFDFTDAGLNVSTRITDKFRVGAQAYVLNVGDLGRGRVNIDWALGDYRFADWLGIRAGKVKTVFGLYTDTQDAEFLHTWALLPQSLYPLDLRSNYLAHIGSDVYGRFSLAKAGAVAYNAFWGGISVNRVGGFAYGLQERGLNASKISGIAKGADLRWTTPISGLVVGASFLDSPKTIRGIDEHFSVPFTIHDDSDKQQVFYGQYTLGNLRLEGEYRRSSQKLAFEGGYGPSGPPIAALSFDRDAWYVACAYRLAKHLEVGAYNSRSFLNIDPANQGLSSLPDPARHIFDQTVTARIDVTSYWDVKVEGHFISGYGDPGSFMGFYPQNNPDGLKPNTNLFILRTGVNF